MRKKDIDILTKQLSDYGITEPINPKNIDRYVCFVAYTFLPQEIQIFVFGKCKFVVFNSDVAATTIGTDKREYLIVVNGNISYRENIAHTIAHEVAHAWLGHRDYSDKQREQEADRQVRAWGVPTW